MNRSALKSGCILLAGVMLGCAVGRPPWWGAGSGVGNGSPPVMTAQSRPGVEHDAGAAGSGSEASIGKTSQERLERLADSFTGKGSKEEDEMAEDIALTLEAGKLSTEELGPLITLMAEDGKPGKAVKLLMVRWAMLDPAAAVAFALDRKEFKNDWRLMPGIVRELAKSDLAAAKEAVRRLPEFENLLAQRSVVRLIQRRNAPEALAYAREMGNERAELEVLMTMAENDPMTAAAELTPGRRDQKEVVEQIAASLLKRDRAAFEAWHGSLRDSGQRADARSQALILDAGTDPKGAAQAAAAWLAEEPEAVAAMQDGGLSESIVRSWMKAEAPPSEVGAWVASLPAGLLRDWAISEMGRLWPDEDTVTASAWLASLPASEGRDNAVQSLVERISEDSPADAFEWALTMRNPLMRYETLMTALESWAEADSAAARGAVERLPPEDRGYLLEALQEDGKEEAGEQK